MPWQSGLKGASIVFSSRGSHCYHVCLETERKGVKLKRRREGGGGRQTTVMFWRWLVGWFGERVSHNITIQENKQSIMASVYKAGADPGGGGGVLGVRTPKPNKEGKKRCMCACENAVF